MRIFLWILLILLLLTGLLMALTAVLHVQYWEGTFTWQLRICGISIPQRFFQRKKKSGEDASEKNVKPEKKSRKSRKVSAPELTQEQKKKLLADRIWTSMQKNTEKADTIGSILFSLPVKMLLRGVSLCRIQIDFLIADEDAARCAWLYGEVQAGVHTLLAKLSRIIKVKQKGIRIGWDYTADACRWDCKADLRVRVGPLLTAALYFWMGYQRDKHRAQKALSGSRL